MPDSLRVLGGGTPLLTTHGGKAREHPCRLADLPEQLRPGVCGDIVCDRECAICTCAFRMYHALEDAFAVEMRRLLVQEVSLE